MSEGAPKFAPVEKLERQSTPDELREKMLDPSFLPTHEQIRQAFPPETEENDWGNFDEEKYRKSFDSFCRDEENRTFEFLNMEFIDAFSDYLTKRAQSLGASEQNPVVILVVGAGNGRLSHFLQDRFDEKLLGQIKVVATDSGEWDIKSAFPVEKLGHEEALQKYQPKIVVFSWMPHGEDCTDAFRAAESVQEYVLVGETDFGCCGDEWLTWGYQQNYDFDDEGNEIEKEPEIPPYARDGFTQKYVEEMFGTQICRTDEIHHPARHSYTVSFKRESK
jgi:hypothetical protein